MRCPECKGYIRNEAFECGACGILVAPDPDSGGAVESAVGINLSKVPVPKYLMLLITAPLLFWMGQDLFRNLLDHDRWTRASYLLLTYAAINVAWFHTHHWGRSLLAIVQRLLQDEVVRRAKVTPPQP